MMRFFRSEVIRIGTASPIKVTKIQSFCNKNKKTSPKIGEVPFFCVEHLKYVQQPYVFNVPHRRVNPRVGTVKSEDCPITSSDNPSPTRQESSSHQMHMHQS